MYVHIHSFIVLLDFDELEEALKRECAWHVGETTAFLQGKGKLVGRVVMGN